MLKLPADEILAWDRMFSELTNRAYRHDLFGANWLINGGGSDDGFYYFRCWLVGMGRAVCLNALANPDSLADVVQPRWLSEGIDAEAEIYSAAYRAWMTVTGASENDPYPVQDAKSESRGPELDLHDDTAMRRVLPRLCKMFED